VKVTKEGCIIKIIIKETLKLEKKLDVIKERFTLIPREFQSNAGASQSKIVRAHREVAWKRI